MKQNLVNKLFYPYRTHPSRSTLSIAFVLLAQMSFFRSVKNKLGQLITSAPETVSTNEQLVTCLQNGAPFKCDPNFKTVYFPYNTHKVLPFIDYLKENTAITSLAIISRGWKQRELKEFVTCLSTFNRGITKLEFVLFDFAPTVMEGFVEILKKNKRIKSIEIQHPTSTFELKLPSGTLTRALNLSIEGFKVFTDNMEHYNIEELIISKSRLNRQCCELLLNGLRSNRSIKKVTIDQEKYLQEEGFSDLCQRMAANRITEFSLTGFTATKSTLNLISLNEVIKANFCRKLRIDGARILNISLAMISEELQTNTSLTDLTLLNIDLDFKILGILIKNKQIRRLEVGHAGLTVDREQIASLNLGSNTTMTDLTLAPFAGIDKATLFSSLRTNQTIRRLKVGAEANLADYDQDLEKFLTTNHSIHDLNIVKSLDESTFRVIVRSLKVNKTIRKLWLQTPRIKGEDFMEFMTIMNTNKSITDLNLAKISEIIPTATLTIVVNFKFLLQTNKTLRYINNPSNSTEVEELLKKNRETQDQIIQNTCMTIKMILARPRQYILPIEIWLHIFEYVEYHFPFDFSKLFMVNK